MSDICNTSAGQIYLAVGLIRPLQLLNSVESCVDVNALIQWLEVHMYLVVIKDVDCNAVRLVDHRRLTSMYATYIPPSRWSPFPQRFQQG